MRVVQWLALRMGWAVVARRTVVWYIDGRCRWRPYDGLRFAGDSCSAPIARMSWARTLLLGWMRGLDAVATPEAFLAKAFLTLGRRDGVL